MPRSEREMLDDVLKQVPARWRAEFRRFVLCGEASDGFMAFLEQNEECLSACDTLLDADLDMAAFVNAAVGEERTVLEAGR